jgi:hypothetical protein
VNPDPKFAERRAYPREAVSLLARVFYGPNLTFWADCTIADLSKGGAKLQISSVYPLPARFRLLQIKGGVVHEVRLRWRRGDMSGVAFDETRMIEGSEDPDLVALEPTWRALLTGA